MQSSAQTAVLSLGTEGKFQDILGTILLIVPVYRSYTAFLNGMAHRLADRGWRVHVATDAQGVEVVGECGVDVHSICMPRGANPIMILQASRALEKLIQQLKPDVVHAHFSISLLVLALTRRQPGIRYFGTFQGMRFPPVTGLSRFLYKCIECFSIYRLDLSWVLTKDDYRAVPSWLKARVQVQSGYGFGCDIDRFDYSRFNFEDRLSLREGVGITNDAFVFIFLGRFTEFKGFALVIDAFVQLRRKYKNVELLVVGEVDELHPLSEGVPMILEGMHICGWQEDPAAYMAIANCMVFPSNREGMPVCVMEAIAMGLPVITSDARGCRDLAEDFVGVVAVERTVASVISAMEHRLLQWDGDIMQERVVSRAERYKIDRQRFYEAVDTELCFGLKKS
ncbi:glycosyltransferase [Cerasicoccus frondis]|uniref:glycosyltransferase n=1 Tax=Cerasicoccus frondis TaxID=490090 RepID=UPI0028529DC7|nr:glycosyltransferase [Cerasicoccus frondis]